MSLLAYRNTLERWLEVCTYVNEFVGAWEYVLIGFFVSIFLLVSAAPCEVHRDRFPLMITL